MLQLRAGVDLRAMAIKGYSHIPQNSSITGASSSDCVVSDPGDMTLNNQNIPTAEMQSVYSAATADWAKLNLRTLELF